MLTLHRISKTFDHNPILRDISFSINPGERVGLIGPNGCGKSTLLQIISGVENPDKGHIQLRPPDLRIGYLPQGFNIREDLTLNEFIQVTIDDPGLIEEKIETIAIRLSSEPGNQVLQDEYDELLARMQKPSIIGNLTATLASFQLGDLTEDQKIATLSGGQKTRLSLAKVLISNPQLLLLDEPTNHLDILMLEWLEDWLLEFSGGILIVTHDRTFLERTATRIIAIDPETKTSRSFEGTYSDYLVQVNQEHEKKWSLYKDQVAEIRRMKQDIARTKEQARQVEISTTSRDPGVRRYAKKVAVKAKSREKKLNRFEQSEERVERPKAGWNIKVQFKAIDHKGKDVLSIRDLSIGYPGHNALLTDLTVNIQSGQRIILTGPNGGGKTTLIRTILGQIEPLSGSLQIGESINPGYMSQEQEILDSEATPVDIIQEVSSYNQTSIRNFLHYFLFRGDETLRKVKFLSFGERSRLMLARLVAIGCNFLLLDEPINHLDIPSREQFEQALKGFDGTVLAVVHDRYFIKRFATEVWNLEGGQIWKEILQVKL